MEYNLLTPEEEQIIIHKGTEKPFSGKFHDQKIPGFYTCKRCDASLYKSQDKFDPGCGRPCFETDITGATKREIDADGIRIELLCARCDAHLGHMFEGESLTVKNVRHCINSISLNFVPLENTQRAVFASGCFWGPDFFFQQARGVLLTTVGYTGGHTENPTYKMVCTGTTGHAEAVEIIFDPEKISYEDLVKLFFQTHDPTQVDRQGPDIGKQYRSEIFYVDENQKKIAEKLMDILKAKGYKLATRLSKASTFWKAEDYHQDYYMKKNDTPYCHKFTQRF